MIQRINYIMQCIQNQTGAKFKYEFKHNKDIHVAEKYGYNVTQLPIVRINGDIEFVGHVKEEHLIRMKLEEIIRQG
jgi:hypothetical protein